MRNNRESLVWNKAFEGTYDSSWCLVEKLSWLNVRKPLDLIRLIAPNHVSLSSRSSDEHGSYIDTGWLEAGKPRAPTLPARTELCEELVRAIEDRSGVQALGFIAPAVLSSRLRGCHTCLAQGYHSVVHQVDGLRICPIHETPLSDACPHCGGNLGLFSARGSSAQFRCDACGVSFLKDGLLKPLGDEIRLGEQTRIKPFLDWMVQASATGVHWPFWSPHWRFRESNSRSLRLTTFQSSLFWCLHKVQPWHLADEYFVAPAAGLELVEIEQGNQLCAWEGVGRRDTRVRESCEAMRNFTARIADGLASTVLQRIGAHLPCLDNVRAIVESSPAGAVFELSANPEICGTAQAFVIWRWRLDRFIENMTFWVRRGWSPTLSESLATILRTDMESLFYYSAHQVAILQSLRSYTMGQRYAMIRTPDCPQFARPDVSFDNGEGVVDVKYMFRLRDDGIFNFLRCDKGAYLQRRDSSVRNIINAMVSDVHSSKA
jgi:hypothetical protein